MENQKTSAKSIILNYGLILGVVSILFSVIVYVINGITMEKPFWEKAIGFIILIVIIILGIKKFKEFNNGFLSLRQSIKTGVGIALIGSIISLIYFFIFVKVIEPNTINQMLEFSQEQMLEQNPEMSDDQIESAMSITKKFMFPIILFIIVLFNLFFGLIISLVVGLVMKKEESYI